MKIILTQEVPGLGVAGDVVTVKDGYGRNFLMPRGFAIAWTRGGQKQVDQIKRARESREIRDLGHAEEIRDQLEAMVINVPVRAGESGKLFGSVTSADVVKAIKAAGGPSLDKRSVALSKAVKTVGKHQAKVQLHPGVAASLVVEVVPEIQD
jgi:large subunit ribosomal protein L9